MWLPLALCIACSLQLPQTWAKQRLELETELIHEWNVLDYNFDKNKKEKMKASGELVPENMQISGLAVNQQNIFLTVPRMKSSSGVPAVLNTVSTFKGITIGGEGGFRGFGGTGALTPWPNEDMQKVGDCNALQNPLALDIDHDTGKLYVLDTGRTGVASSEPDNTCGGKIVVFDVDRIGFGGGNFPGGNFPGGNFPGQQSYETYELDKEVFDKSSSLLSSFVLDYTKPKSGDKYMRGSQNGDGEVRYAYISDGGTNTLIVYDFKNKKTWSFNHPTFGIEDHNHISINGESLTVRFGFNSLAMSPDFNFLYYTSTGSTDLYQIPTHVLRRPDADITNATRLVGTKVSNSDSLYHAKDALYFSALEEDAIYRWETRLDMEEQMAFEGKVRMETQRPVAQNFETMQWPDALNIDERGNLYFTTNKKHLYYSGKLVLDDPEEVNFRVFKVKVNDFSYLDQRLPDDRDDTLF